MSYTNRTGSTVYLMKCKTPSQPALEKKIGDKWVFAYAPIQLMCLEEPIRIKPGETYRDVFYMEAFKGKNMAPNFQVKEVAGTYRLVRSFYKTFNPKGDGTGLGELLPLEEGISNEFKLTR
jgi:hypothetical protein